VTATIRRAVPADAAQLSRLAAETFRDTFGRDNRPADMDRYVVEAFTADRQAAEIADPDGIVLLAERSLASGPEASGAPRLVGYAHLVSGPAPAAVTGAVPLELKRLYVAHAWHGRGVAQALMDAALEAARARGARTLWLGVWERNARAAAFYGKCGFRRVGETTFVLGGDIQTDWLLARPLGDDPSAAVGGR
jgi:ribosomal protein S18 acetylase RimI-like enzyme